MSLAQYSHTYLYPEPLFPSFGTVTLTSQLCGAHGRACSRVEAGCCSGQDPGWAKHCLAPPQAQEHWHFRMEGTEFGQGTGIIPWVKFTDRHCGTQCMYPAQIGMSS